MANEVPKVRFVRCPKCCQLVAEFADVPVYKCGRCGTVLKAKIQCLNKGNNTSQTSDSIASKKNLLEHGSEVGRVTLNDASTFNEQTPPFSTYPSGRDVNHKGDDNACQSEKPSWSENQNHREETSKCNGNVSVETDLTADNPTPTGKSVLTEKGTSLASAEKGQSIPSKRASCLNGQVNDCWKLSQQGYGNSRASSKVEESRDSIVSEEDMNDGNENRGSENMVTATTRTNAFDDSVSSCEGITSNHERYLLLSRRTFRNQKFSGSNSTSGKSGEEDRFLEDKMTADSESHFKSRIFSSKSSDSCGSAVCAGSNQEAHQQSESFHSAQKELENNSPPRSLTRHPVFVDLPHNDLKVSLSTRLTKLENDRMELLRKVDEMRYHLTRTFTKVKKGNQRFHIRDARQASHRPFFCNHESDKELQHSNTNIPQCSSTTFGQTNTVQRYQSSQMPFSGRGNSSCLHHHPEDWCIPAQLPQRILCRACTLHACYHPSTAASPRCCKDPNIAQCCHNGQTSDYYLEKVHIKEKWQTFKRRCRPVSGGAPFVICNYCLQLLQLPVDFLVSRRRFHKLKCGACSKLLIFLSHDGGHIVPHSDTQLGVLPSVVDNGMKHHGDDEFSVNHPHGCLQGDPVSYTEEDGPSFSKSYSTDGEPVAHALRSSLEQDKKDGNQVIGPPLHRLMGYESASELIYPPCDEDEGYESTGTSHVYRMSNEIHFHEKHGGAGMASFQQCTAVKCSPEHTHAKDESVKGSTSERGDSACHSFIKKGTKDLNYEV